MKTNINDVIEVYRTGIERIRALYNDHYERAVNALHRGDTVNYKKAMNEMKDLETRLDMMNKLMDEVVACTM